MLGFSSRDKKGSQKESSNEDIAKLFFDSFSKRVASVEEGLRKLSVEVGKLQISIDQGHISDIVLLERLQKAEKLLGESVAWVKTILGQVDSHQFPNASVMRENEAALVQSEQSRLRSGEHSLIPAQKLVSVSGEVGTLPSITTPTELQVLTLLASEGPKSAPEIGIAVGRSREHSSRLMKKLFQEGYVRRDQTRIPFRYSLTERVKQTFKKPETKDAGKEAVSIPQT